MQAFKEEDVVVAIAVASAVCGCGVTTAMRRHVVEGAVAGGKVAGSKHWRTRRPGGIPGHKKASALIKPGLEPYIATAGQLQCPIAGDGAGPERCSVSRLEKHVQQSPKGTASPRRRSPGRILVWFGSEMSFDLVCNSRVCGLVATDNFQERQNRCQRWILRNLREPIGEESHYCGVGEVYCAQRPVGERPQSGDDAAFLRRHIGQDRGRGRGAQAHPRGGRICARLEGLMGLWSPRSDFKARQSKHPDLEQELR
jgi:hypothetical protein